MKKTKVLFLILVFVMMLSMNCYGYTLKLMELDEVSESGYLVIKNCTINADSPLRVGDVGTGNNDFTTINCSYNEPRSGGSHGGVDLNSKDSSGNGRALFALYNNGEIYELHTTISNDYGKYVKVQYRHYENGSNYYFQSLYAHLDSIDSSLSVGDDIDSDDEVGISGNTGGSFGTHLHLELRGASSSYSSSTRRYPPNFFFSDQSNSYKLNMSFINRTYASPTSVIFRLVSMDLGNEVVTPSNKATFYYKADGASSWSTAPMTVWGSDDEFFTASIDSLYSNYIYYYIKAENNAYNGSTYYTSYRPYRYDDGPPTTRPFYETSSKSQIFTQTKDLGCTVIDVNPEDLNPDGTLIDDKFQDIEYDIKLTGIIKTIVSKEEIVVTYDKDNKDYSVIIKGPKGGPDLKEGVRTKVNGWYSNSVDKNGNLIILSEGGLIRVFEE